MIPILYDSTETAFTSQGLGCLTDAISCEVTEERNGQFELEMVYPISGIHYSDITHSRYVCGIPADGEDAQPFEIYKISRPLDGKITVYARHLSYRLGYTPVRPTTAATSAESALNTLKSAAVVDCPFTFSSDVLTAGTFTNDKLQSLRSLLGGQTGSILDVFGGEYKFDKWKVRLLKARGSSIPVSIEYGKNLTDLRQDENIESTYTAVICTWQKDVDGVTTRQIGDIVHTDNKDKFPYVRTLVVDKSTNYSDQPTVAQLTADATAYIKANNVGVPKVSIDVSFVNLRDTEEYKNVAPLQRIHLCDTIKVQFSKLGVDASAKITKTVYDVLNERYKSLTIGDSRSTLAGTVVGITEQIDSKTQQATEEMTAEMQRISKVMQGGLGGYVVQRMNETTGYPEETLYLDQPDLKTAKKVLRINKNGIAFSTDGYQGTYNSAWLIDGTFIANWIKSGTLSTVQIQALKKIGDVLNFWNLSNGTFFFGDANTHLSYDGSLLEILADKLLTKDSKGNSIAIEGAKIESSDSSGNSYTLTGASAQLVNSDGAYSYITPDSIGFYSKGGASQGYYGRTFMRFGKTGHGNGAGRGLYADEYGISFGMAGSDWNLQPVFKVYQYGDIDLVEVTGLRFKNKYGNSAGAVTWYSGWGEKGLTCNTNLYIDGHCKANDFESEDGWSSGSDRRLKQDISALDIEESARFVMSLIPSRYAFKKNPDRIRHGFIAQEVDDVGYGDWTPVSDSVINDGYLRLDYTELIADLVATIQYQEARIDSLEERLAVLEEVINANDHA